MYLVGTGTRSIVDIDLFLQTRPSFPRTRSQLMASYADDHASYAEENARTTSRDNGTRLSRNDPLLTSFFSTERSEAPTVAMFQNLAQALQNHDPSSNPLMARMIEQLLSESSSSHQGAGVDQSFLDTLDRVPKQTLKPDDSCPICATPYLDDKYPLVVSLKCRHSFDLECITPWLKLHTTCPMCRAEVQKSRQAIILEDSEEEYDDCYG